MRNVDLVAISEDLNTINFCETLSSDYGYTFRSVPSVDQFAEQEVELRNTTLILLSADKSTVDTEIAGMVQVVKHMAPEAYVVVTIDSKLDPNVAIFVKKSGANLVLMNSELTSTSRLQFVASQKILSSFLPIRIDELKAGTTVQFNVYHSMPLNKKFLPILNAGILISEEKINKLKEIRFVYIRRGDIAKFQEYCQTHRPPNSTISVGEVRSQFLSLSANYADLLLMMVDQSEKIAYSKGHALYAQCEKLGQTLLDIIEQVKDPWEVLQEAATGPIGGLERSAVIASYAGLFCQISKVGNPIKAMVAALLADLSYLDFDAKLSQKIRADINIGSLTAEEKEIYTKHPISSLNIALNRKFQFPEDIKDILLCSHETYDRKGFPNQPRADKIPTEAIIIQLAAKFDRLTYAPMGKPLPDLNMAKQLLFESELKPLSTSNYLLVEKLRTILLKSPTPNAEIVTNVGKVVVS